MRRAPRSIAFDGGLVVLASHEHLLLLDNLAGQIWLAVESGLDPSEIAGALSLADPAYSGDIHRDVSALVSQWSADGLLDLGEHLGAQCPDPASLSVNLAWAGKWRCCFRDLVVDIAVENPRAAILLGRLFEHFRTGEADASACVEVRGSSDETAIIAVNGREYARTCSVRNVQRALIQLLWPRHPLCAIMHAGAVAHRNRAACFSGISGSGKTTLIARLVGRGLTYLADDFTAISTSGEVLPWPMPMSVKVDSWGLLSDHYPKLNTAPMFNVKGTQARSLKLETDAWQLGPTPAHVLIFPKFLRGRSTHLSRLTPFEALRRLIEAGFLLESPIDVARAEAVLAWLSAVPAHDLSYGDVDEAASVAASLL